MSPSNPNLGTKIAAAKRMVIREGAARSNELRLKIAEADPIGFLIAVYQGRPVGGEEAEDGTFPDGEVLSLKDRVELGKFLSNKVVSNIAPQHLDMGSGDSDVALWAKFLDLDELPEVEDVEVEDVEAENGHVMEPEPFQNNNDPGGEV